MDTHESLLTWKKSDLEWVAILVMGDVQIKLGIVAIDSPTTLIACSTESHRAMLEGQIGDLIVRGCLCRCRVQSHKHIESEFVVVLERLGLSSQTRL